MFSAVCVGGESDAECRYVRETVGGEGTAWGREERTRVWAGAERSPRAQHSLPARPAGGPRCANGCHMLLLDPTGYACLFLPPQARPERT
ncbi:hypothetical protein AAFF_G00406210 [Aldrovandia affinis]|uniref:Uncharacterized protein n=1 Tax=Aldrovandia affinis TaxID=143900 RepID=A0AAD7SEI3_9TELE|nr:hypothetical protein AAFF_G00406210 [Aldrovandia affinis]